MTDAMSNLESPVDAGNETEATELWHVQLSTGEVKLWSLDQLDAAYQADLINEWTHVLQDGTTEWMKLGELLGIEPSANAPESVPASAAPAQVVDESATPGPVSVSPVSIAPPSSVAYSVRPVAVDIGGADDLDLDAMALKPKKRGLAIGLAVAALVLVGIGAAVTAGSNGSGPSAATVAAAAAAALPPVVATPVAAPPPQAAPTPAPADAPATTTADSRFTESQRKALLDADKSRDAARKARASAATRHAPRVSSKPVFHKGGNKYDPLNSQL